MLGSRGQRIAALAALALAAPARADDKPTLTTSQKLALFAKPSVVRVWGAYVGTFSFKDKTWKEAIGGTGSGFFLAPDGYIATNAHVVESIHDGDDKAKETLEETARESFIKAFRGDLERMTQQQVVAILRQIQLADLRKLSFVVLPNGDNKVKVG